LADDGDLARSHRLVSREAARIARLDATNVGQEFRELRLRLGVRQSDVARVAGVARSVISELEAGDPSVGLAIQRRTAIALGADLRVHVYPGSTPMLHDAGHGRIIERIVASRHRRWQAELEARVPGGGRTSIDVRLSMPGSIVLIEVETRVRRWEQVLRQLFEKRESVRAVNPDGVQVYAVLCLPPTRHHRALVSELGESVRTALPANSDELRRALEEGTAWPGDGILWVAGGQSRPRSRAPRRVAAGEQNGRASAQPGQPAG
jgi:transcriptional regulator with XRE-family HTH domain